MKLYYINNIYFLDLNLYGLSFSFEENIFKKTKQKKIKKELFFWKNSQKKSIKKQKKKIWNRNQKKSNNKNKKKMTMEN